MKTTEFFYVPENLGDFCECLEKRIDKLLIYKYNYWIKVLEQHEKDYGFKNYKDESLYQRD